jgi:nucleoside-diphosphate-sugar epimerase
MVLVNGARGRFNGIYIDNLAHAVLLALEHPDAPGQIFHLSDEEPVTWRRFLEEHARALDESLLPLPAMKGAELTRIWRLMGDDQPPPESVDWDGASDPPDEESVVVDQSAREPLPGEPEEEYSLLMRIRRSRPVCAAFRIPGVWPVWASIRRAAGSPIPPLPPPPPPAPPQEPPAPALTLARVVPDPLPLSRHEAEMFRTFEQAVFTSQRARRLLGYEPLVSFDEGISRTAQWIRWARL